MGSRERVLYWPETYLRHSELGRGVSGVVYKAAQKETNQIVAIKLVDLNQNRSSWEQVQGEINALLALNSPKQHQNIIKLIECFRHKTTAIFVLEYIDGGTLEDFMYTFDEGLPIPLVSHIVYQVISAIEFMNKNKCSHRDIKPANILLMSNRKKVDISSQTCGDDENEGNQNFSTLPASSQQMQQQQQSTTTYCYRQDDLPVIKITDYGYASINKNDNDMHSTLAGSPLYMPPEVIHIILSPNLERSKGKIVNDTNNEGYNPLLVDVWAIGAVTFRLITGRELINEIFPNLNQTTVLAALVNLAKMVDTDEFQKGLDLIPQKMKEYGVQDEDSINFIVALLKLDPKERLPLHDTLNHPFLQIGRKSFDETIINYNQTSTSSSLPSDINELTRVDSSVTKDNNNNIKEEITTTTTSTQQQQQQQQDQSSQPSLSQENSTPKSTKTDDTSDTPTTTPVITTTTTTTTSTITSSLTPQTKNSPPWSFQKPSTSLLPSIILSPQRKLNTIKLLPSMLPNPGPEAPAQDTMIWRNPPQPCAGGIWTTIIQDPIFHVQYGVLTSIINTFSSNNTNYEYRIITQTKSPVEIAVSNYKESILYMYNIVKTVVTPQLISLSSNSNDSSILRALCTILQQLDQEQEVLSFSSGWTVLL
ncbi:putative protein serine/threonine kinase [Cavenderia fasciculata]|uniref:Protein kinase domain-containing protein n=1 Tax=Cavenderia fasciculata TaxID=261658 RepID=F4PR44_CACFS|nr:putative protein serine/threonine kinase [Cavenderia fasciculata]EGG22101.1 putative protein serine/threonine kinase [Cavenderia fasciculata]|eukprot:XP_004359952.1 putative protein serine/threonine kinase [Cavenderia fasciculata]